jgi:hypothetical protein
VSVATASRLHATFEHGLLDIDARLPRSRRHRITTCPDPDPLMCSRRGRAAGTDAARAAR